MFLESLQVIVSGQVIRKVTFRRGLNLIGDATPPPRMKSDTTAGTKDRPRTGNNVGKTTVLRCVDYCLGGKEESLYLDREFKTPNRAVHDFLTQKAPVFVLRLTSGRGIVTTLARRFGEAGGSYDGEELSGTAYADALRQHVFKIASTKPTLREITPKFVRVEDTSLKNILKWIYMGTDSQYEAAWLTLFGFTQPDLFRKRGQVEKELDKLKQQEGTLRQLSASPRQERPLVERRLAQLTKQLANLSLEGAYTGSLDELKRIRAKVRETNQLLAGLEAELGQVRRTLDAIASESPKIDLEELQELYEDAGRYIEPLQSDFAKLVEFHETLTKNKTSLVDVSRTRLEQALLAARNDLEHLLREESVLLQAFVDPDVFADVRQLSDQIAKLSHRKGELESTEKLLREIRQAIEFQTQELRAIEDEIAQEKDNVDRAVELFNRHFADYTHRLYGEEYMLAFEFEAKKGGATKVVGRISNLEGHEGSGKKKGLIAAFDLAYLKYRQEIESRSARFTLADEVEVIDTNQLATLFQIAETIDGQFVTPILRDRLSRVHFEGVERCVILELSQDDRFFGIA